MQEAFLNVIDQYQNIDHKVTRLYRDSLEDRQDLFQEIVFQLWKAFPGFRGDAKISTWMYRIALNTAMTTYRKRKISIETSDVIPEHLHPTDQQESSENQEKLFLALRQLNDSEKAIISLYLEDYSYQEIASITGITENYVGVKINRIKEKLKLILNR